MLKKRIYIASSVLVFVLLGLVLLANHQAHRLHRDPLVLMNKYYELKYTNPTAAKTALLLILQQNNHDVLALKELTQWSLDDTPPEQLIPWFEKLHQHLPNHPTYTYQLAYLYYQSGAWEKSHRLFTTLHQKVSGSLKFRVEQALAAMGSSLPHYQTAATIVWQQPLNQTTERLINTGKAQAVTTALAKTTFEKVTVATQLLNQYYTQNHKNRQLLHQIIHHDPQNIQALKEAGYLAIEDNQLLKAIHYFTAAYQHTHDPLLAMQLAYLYDRLNQKPNAYQYFKLATKSTDNTQSLRAQNALTALRGLQTKALPTPYFSEIFFNPFTQSRFGLTVTPLIWRMGVEQPNRFHTKAYVFVRRTQDNRSANLGELSQLYEDNVQITGFGGQFSPFAHLPIVGFLEAGAAYDLIYQNRERWRGDLRGGFMYYQELGARPAYFDQLKIGNGFYSDWYADTTYFSRYKNNVISLIRTHQGLRLAQYKSSMLNLYMTGRVIADTNRLFFNNIAELGPGIGLIPSNRFNLELHYEYIRGVYLPAGGGAPNPYSKYYNNQLVQLLFYVKI